MWISGRQVFDSWEFDINHVMKEFDNFVLNYKARTGEKIDNVCIIGRMRGRDV